jgi:hypothetical protein
MSRYGMIVHMMTQARGGIMPPRPALFCCECHGEVKPQWNGFMWGCSVCEQLAEDTIQREYEEEVCA